MGREPELVTDMVAAADRLEGLADTAELMDDPGNAQRFRRHASALRHKAMSLLDHETETEAGA